MNLDLSKTKQQEYSEIYIEGTDLFLKKHSFQHVKVQIYKFRTYKSLWTLNLAIS